MKLTEFFLEELEQEAAATRRVLEQVPEGKGDWQPHPRSMRLGYLAGLVATLPAWIDLKVNTEEFDLRPVGGPPVQSPEFATSAELLKALDESVEKARAALLSTNDEHLLKPWRFLVGGKVIVELPRYKNIQSAVFNHMAHHRGQLTAYLRLNEALVPAIYGPSADERGF